MHGNAALSVLMPSALLQGSGAEAFLEQASVQFWILGAG
jgi:hypothetical protein